MTYDEIIARSRKNVVTETTYDLPEDVPIEEGQGPNERVRPTRVTVKEFDDGDIRISVTGYQVRKDGTRKANSASWHGIVREARLRYEAALGFTRVPRS